MEDISLIRVVGVEYIKDYIMQLEFSNGKTKEIDFLPLLKGKMYEPLKDKKMFIQFALTSWTLEWVNGADFAPEYLYEIGTEVKSYATETKLYHVAEPPDQYKKTEEKSNASNEDE